MTRPDFIIIPLEKLQLDSDNPRLPVSMHGKPEAEILEYMLLDASLIELMLAIGKNDFFPGEQLLVTANVDDTYKVVEGNRRLSALKLLNDPGLARVQRSKIHHALAETQYRPTEIPCLLFETEEDIHKYLGYRHITGIKEWKLLEKARYLYNLWKNVYTGQSINTAAREIAKSIGSRKDYVKRILIGYEIYRLIEDEKFYRIPGLDDTTFHFNYIADSLNKSYISEFLGIDLGEESEEYVANLSKDNLKEWTYWLFEKNSQNRTRLIGDSHDLTALNRILSIPEAKAAFRKGASLEDAVELTGELDEQFLNAISQGLKAMETADRLSLKADVPYDQIYSPLKEIRSLATKIARTMETKEDEDEL